MYCSMCGEKAAVDARFCSACGARLPQKPSNEQRSHPTHSPKKPVVPSAEAPPVRRARDGQPRIPEERREKIPVKKSSAPPPKTPPKDKASGAAISRPREETPPRVRPKAASPSKNSATPTARPAQSLPPKRLAVPQSDETLWQAEEAASAMGSQRKVPNTFVPPRDPTARRRTAIRATDAPSRMTKPRPKTPLRSDLDLNLAEEEEPSFIEQHLRSVIAILLLAMTLGAFAVWTFWTPSGQRTAARIGLGRAQGYALLGSDCMEIGNTARAVEYYLKALSMDDSFEYAYHLALAYQRQGDIANEARTLMKCIDLAPDQKAPYVRLAELFPNERSLAVQHRITQGIERFGSL